MKKALVLLIVFILSFPSMASAKEATLHLVINDKVITGAPPVTINGTTYIPLRNFFENISFNVQYDKTSKTASAFYTQGPIKLSFAINSDIVGIDSMLDNGQSVNVRISGKPIIYKNSVYVPMRAFGELLGAELKYDPVFYGVFLNLTDQQVQSKIYPRVGIPADWSYGSQQNNIPGTAPTAKDIYNQLSVTVGYVEVVDNYNEVKCTGSGFMANPGVFVTNYHVATCHESGRLIVKLASNTYTNGTEGWYLFENQDTDLYGLYISTSFDKDGVPTGAIPPYYLNLYETELPEIGDKVYAIGSPLGLENTISEGIISGIREIDGITYIQHTCDTQPGSSGGVLLDEYGYLIGVTSAGIEGTSLNFALPTTYILDEYKKKGIETVMEE